MIRRAFDERCVLFNGRDDNILQLVLSLNEFRSFVDDRHILPPYELSASLDAGKTRSKRNAHSVPWAGATPRFFGQPKAPKSGVAPARLGVLPASDIDCRAMRNLYAPTNFRSPSG